MAQLRFAPAAARDLRKITEDIEAAKGRSVALAFVDRLHRSLEGLVHFPRIGRRRTGFGPGVRSWAFPPYVTFYRPSGDDVEIIRVVHGARRITRTMLRGG